MNLEKLKKVLAENGLSEEEIAKIIAELENNESDNENDGNDDGKPEEDEPTSTDDDSNEEDDLPPASKENGNGEGEIPQSENEPSPAEVPPLPPEGNVPQNEELPPVPPTDVPPVDEPTVPPQDPTVPQAPTGPDPELLGKIEEQAKTIDGLLARIESLEEALKKSGILDGNTEEVGTDKPNVPDSASAQVNDEFDDVLGEINRRAKNY